MCILMIIIDNRIIYIFGNLSSIKAYAMTINNKASNYQINNNNNILNDIKKDAETT